MSKSVQSDFNCRHAEFHIDNEWGIKNFENFLIFLKSPIFALIKKWLGATNGLSINFDIHSTYRGIVDNFEEECSTKLQTKNWKILPKTNLEGMHKNLIEYINLRHENLQQQLTDTQWVLISIDKLIINFNKYVQLRGSSYIKLLEALTN